MKLRLDDLLRAAGLGGGGAIWGLGLARLAAEAGFQPSFYGSPTIVTGVAVVGAVAAITLQLRPRRSPRSLDPASSKFYLFFFVLVALPLPYVTGVVAHPLAGCVLVIGGAALALLVVWENRPRWVPPFVLGISTLALYLRTLLPSVGVADTFEFQVVVPRLAIAHPTGYPLYVLLGKLFTLLPLGDVAWRVNLASAVFATAAVLVLYLLLLRPTIFRQPQDACPRSIPIRWLSAFLAALTFAFSSTFWSQAVIAEVYTLHNLFVAVILWFLLDPFPFNLSRLSPARRWQAIFFLMGLSLTNHLPVALLLPAVALALLWDRPRLRLREWAIAGGAFCVGLSVYLFIPLRWPAINDGEWMTLRGFLFYVTGGQFHAALQLDGWRDPARWLIVWRLLGQPGGWIGLALVAVGLGRLTLHQRRTLALTGVTFLAFAAYGLTYHVPDVAVFLLPAHLILAVWMGCGASYLTGLIGLLFSSTPARMKRSPSGRKRPRLAEIAARLRPFAGGGISLLVCAVFGFHCLSR
ncbi:MAG: hypothetical protein DRI48_07125, partial [Chloroflexi bacterium]